MSEIITTGTSIKRVEVFNDFDIRRIACIVSKNEAPVFGVNNKYGFKEGEIRRTATSGKDLLDWGFNAESEAYKFLSACFIANGKYVNFPNLPFLSKKISVECILKGDETLEETLAFAFTDMPFKCFGIVIAKSLYGQNGFALNETVKLYSKSHFIFLEDDKLFGEDVKEVLKAKMLYNHFFLDLIENKYKTVLTYQMPRQRSALEQPISAVVASYVCATFGTKAPGGTIHAKTLEGVSAEALPSAAINELDEVLKEKINSYRSDYNGSFVLGKCSNGEMIEVEMTSAYFENVCNIKVAGLMKNSEITYDDAGFKKVSNEISIFLGNLKAANLIDTFEILMPLKDELSTELKDDFTLEFTCEIVVKGFTRKINLGAIFAKYFN